MAYLMLAAWPAICVGLFARFSVERALIWSFLGAYMLLPPVTEFDLPLVPAMDKNSIPSVAALVIMVAFLGLRPSFLPRHRITRLLIAMMLVGAVLTVLTNTDGIVFHQRIDLMPIDFPVGMLPGLRLIDTLSALASTVILLIPFFLARAYLATDKGLRELMLAFLIAGLIYTVPALIEIRLSPQMNVWFYGFFQHSFEQMVRDGGFRPIVFMPHALWLALFFVMAMSAGAALMRDATHQTRWRYMLATAYLVVVIYLCKSLASQIYMVLLLPLILLAAPKWQIRVALAFAAVAILYPMLRNLGLIPLDLILAKAELISAERAQSLGFRFMNEEILLDRASERSLFGWGGWGRNLLHADTSGEIVTIADGRWIIVFGTAGWFGYVSQMGLVVLPLVLMARALRTHAAEDLSPMIAPLCLMLGFTVVDMLLNDTLVPMTLLMVGAILGYAERLTLPDDSPRTLFPNGPVIGRRKGGGKRTVM
ncbi:hypothetical protein [Aestuariivita boseongensis]|uniref:hypothetical protein n=1 Tax=Aestuariivita boseongensis TaxID=1470562 RepID=UPI0012FA7B5C|nr:hypothetical protein [Aestuariivita boseongensis]